MTDTINIVINKTEYIEIAAVGAQGIYSNPQADDYIYIAYSATKPTASFLGHSIAPHQGHDFTLSPNLSAKIWSRLADGAIRAEGFVVVTLGWA